MSVWLVVAAVFVVVGLLERRRAVAAGERRLASRTAALAVLLFPPEVARFDMIRYRCAVDAWAAPWPTTKGVLV